MKNLFTKCLPVEGKIQVGDKAIRPDGRIISVDSLEMGSGENYFPREMLAWEGDENLRFWTKLSELKKVKFFLCSRDIQVGDITWDGFEVASLPNEEGCYRLVPHNGVIGMSGHWEKNPIKKIGEVSPDATWITEGMEFEEDDVKEWWWNYYFNKWASPYSAGDQYTNYGDLERAGNARRYIRFRCPSSPKHFH